jgi:hypothetical protein
MKRWISKLRVGITLVIVLSMVSVIVVLAADVVIDAFSSVTQTISYQVVQANLPVTQCDYAVTSSDSLGGHRDVCMTVESGDQDAPYNFRVSAIASNQYLSLGLDSSVSARGFVQWDGSDNTSAIDPIGLQDGSGNGIDLTDSGSNDGVLLRVIYSDGVMVNLTLRIYTDGSNWGEETVSFASTVVAGDVIDVFIPFDALRANQTGTMDETDVGAVELEIDGTLVGEAGADITIDFIKATSLYDFGDLPLGYVVTDAEGGAKHVTGSLHLGPSVDAEADGTHSAAGTAIADDDDFTPDDEDGVTRQPSLSGGGTHGGWTNGAVSTFNGGRLSLEISGGDGVPQVFVDFGSGLTEVTLRDMFGNVLATPLSEGTHDVYFDIPNGTFDGNNNISIPVRVRLSSAGGLGVGGTAPDGEVEDYIFDFGPNAVTLSAIDAGPALAGWPAFALVIAAVAGGAGLFVWKRRA